MGITELHACVSKSVVCMWWTNKKKRETKSKISIYNVVVLLPCSAQVDRKHMSHFTYAYKMRCPLNLVLENWENLHFY